MANSRPWWMDDPKLIELREGVLAEIESAVEPAGLHEPDPVVAEIYSGAAGRALSAARDDLAEARQQIHRQFRNRVAD